MINQTYSKSYYDCNTSYITLIGGSRPSFYLTEKRGNGGKCIEASTLLLYTMSALKKKKSLHVQRGRKHMTDCKHEEKKYNRSRLTDDLDIEVNMSNLK